MSESIVDWCLDRLPIFSLALVALIIGVFAYAQIHDEKVRQSMVGKTRDQFVQAWGPPSSITHISNGEVDTWAQYHESTTTYVYTGGQNGGVAVPVQSPAYTERTVVTFVNGVATRVEHP